MTLKDFDTYFSYGYNVALNFKAPGLDVFEKSLYLTNAYRSLVKEYVATFEETELNKAQLGKLVKHDVIDYNTELNNTTLAALKIDTNSRIFQLPDDVWHIFIERLQISEGNTIKVIPKRLDEYNEIIINPFQQPNSKKAWRLTVADSRETPAHIVEIISTQIPSKYIIRYLEDPGVIILEDLNDGDLIFGKDTATLPKIGAEFHQAIVDKAVILATRDYKESSLQAQIALKDS